MGSKLHEGGGNCLKYLEMGWNRKEGKGSKDFKKGASYFKGWVLKKGAETPLWTMVIESIQHFLMVMDLVLFDLCFKKIKKKL